MDELSPLSGVRVIELGEGIAGPWAGLLLADLGAQVIKVESITRLDLSRGPAVVSMATASQQSGGFVDYPDTEPGDRPWNRNSRCNSYNLSKLGITLDLSQPRGLQIFLRLIAISDIFISNMAAGVAERMGINYDALVKIKPDIICISSTGYGSTGPYRDRMAMGNAIDAASGVFGLRDYGDGDSTSVSPSIHCDSITAATSAFAAVTALYHRKKTGRGMSVDVSMVEPSMTHIGEAIMDYTMNQRVQHSWGNRHMSRSPQGCYCCQGHDEWVTISVSSDAEWQRFLKATTGKIAWPEDGRFDDILGRLKNRDEMDKLIESWTVHQDKLDIMNMLQEAGVASGAVFNNGDVYNCPHNKQRGFFETIEHPEAGIHAHVGRLWRFEETTMPARSHSPCLGEYTATVLKELVGLTPDEIKELEQNNIIGTIPAVLLKKGKRAK